ncbi:MAG: glycoside hydrolase family 3 C-terminal domain-containing protein [Erysipelotrichaceae bacterium]|nr:glycoside hydrolase family 3 C-terminal domain-containing protein [Erysipelotrichaceae bacterium]
MNIQEIISKMTLEEKIRFCTGEDCWRTKELSDLGVPSIMMSDGPHGLRCQVGKADMLGINNSLPATCFPTALTAAQTWNPELISKEGKAIAEEAIHAGVSIVLGPGCNIKRNPLCGRNFEYFSEDPYVSGKMASAWIQGLQSTGVLASLKHFALNNQETKRQNGNSLVDERTMHEIYLKPFEIAVKEAHPGTVMCCYNKVNGIHGSDHKELLSDILRTQWGFDGLVVTDWGAMNDRIKAFQAGCDLNMPGANRYMEKALLKAVQSGQLNEKEIDRSVERLLKLIDKCQIHKEVNTDFDEHHNLSRHIAEEGAVLLKNTDHLLPLQNEDVCLIGYMAQDLRYQGTGSSHINPTHLKQLTEVWDVPYVSCCDKEGNVTETSLKEAENLAKNHQIAIVVAGLPELYESEGFDRDHMCMPEGHNQMIETVTKVNPNTVVLLLGGSAMEVPWIESVKSVLYMALPGQAGAEAIVSLLKGKNNPSGKLTETWPMSYQDVICKDTFGQKNTEYREGIYVGYRYYDKAQTAVRFPFGYGLSYTSFAYDDMQIEGNKVKVQITNTGSMKGSEVVQLYVSSHHGLRPVKELKRFKKIELEPKESKSVEFELNQDCFEVWDKGWKVIQGNYEIQIGSSSQQIHCTKPLQVDGIESVSYDSLKGTWYETLEGSPSRNEWEQLMGHPVPVEKEAVQGEFTWDNTVLEMKEHSGIMKFFVKIVELFISKQFGWKKDMTNPTYRMMITSALDCPIRAMVINVGNIMSDNMAEGLIMMANGHFFKGLFNIFK